MGERGGKKSIFSIAFCCEGQMRVKVSLKYIIYNYFTLCIQIILYKALQAVSDIILCFFSQPLRIKPAVARKLN